MRGILHSMPYSMARVRLQGMLRCALCGTLHGTLSDMEYVAWDAAWYAAWWHAPPYAAPNALVPGDAKQRPAGRQLFNSSTSAFTSRFHSDPLAVVLTC